MSFCPKVWFGSGMRPNPHGKSHHFLSKCHGNSMTRTCPKSMSCSSMENKYSVDKWHGMVMEFVVRRAFGSNLFRRFVTMWNDSEFPWEPIPYFLQGRGNVEVWIIYHVFVEMFRAKRRKKGTIILFLWVMRDGIFWSVNSLQIWATHDWYE